MGFEDCPICGKKLTWNNVRYIDEDGDLCGKGRNGYSEITEYIQLGCKCGFNFVCHESKVGFIIDPKWSEKFEALANRRKRE